MFHNRLHLSYLFLVVFHWSGTGSCFVIDYLKHSVRIYYNCKKFDKAIYKSIEHIYFNHFVSLFRLQ